MVAPTAFWHRPLLSVAFYALLLLPTLQPLRFFHHRLLYLPSATHPHNTNRITTCHGVRVQQRIVRCRCPPRAQLLQRLLAEPTRLRFIYFPRLLPSATSPRTMSRVSTRYHALLGGRQRRHANSNQTHHTAARSASSRSPFIQFHFLSRPRDGQLLLRAGHVWPQSNNSAIPPVRIYDRLGA